MATISEGEELDFEQGVLWLTSHVLDEAFETKSKVTNHHQKQQQQVQNSSKPHAASLSTAKQSRHGSRWHTGPKLSTTRASGGPGMQAVFIGSGQRSSGGTGVFLPQRTGTTYQPSKKPACSPVLIPARVVQALNLDVHALGLQISPWQETKSNCRGVENHNKNKNADDFTVHSLLSSTNHSSPELFLPKEWTY